MPGEVWIGLPIALAVAGGSALYAASLRNTANLLDAADPATQSRAQLRERRRIGRRLRLAWLGIMLGATMGLALLTPPRERPSLFVAAWFSTSLLALTAIVYAGVDLWATRAEARAERTRLEWEKQALERRLGRPPSRDD